MQCDPSALELYNVLSDNIRDEIRYENMHGGGGAYAQFNFGGKTDEECNEMNRMRSRRLLLCISPIRDRAWRVIYLPEDGEYTDRPWRCTAENAPPEVALREWRVEHKRTNISAEGRPRKEISGSLRGPVLERHQTAVPDCKSIGNLSRIMTVRAARRSAK